LFIENHHFLAMRAGRRMRAWSDRVVGRHSPLREKPDSQQMVVRARPAVVILQLLTAKRKSGAFTHCAFDQRWGS
jgi:hypothetical protein